MCSADEENVKKSIIYVMMMFGPVAQWESTGFAYQRLRVRVPSGPYLSKCSEQKPVNGGGDLVNNEAV